MRAKLITALILYSEYSKLGLCGNAQHTRRMRLKQAENDLDHCIYSLLSGLEGTDFIADAVDRCFHDDQANRSD